MTVEVLAGRRIVCNSRGMGSSDSGPDFSLELQAMADGHGVVAGIDEAGRGPWAGPVVAAAVVLDPKRLPDGLDDSKKLSAARRDLLYDQIMTLAAVGVGIVDAAGIDRQNILQATFSAMVFSLNKIAVTTDFAIVDGNRLPPLQCPARAVVRGDGRSLSIAAASIVAKVTRDRIMQQLDVAYPGYDFARHKGYGTALHQSALERLGPCQEHRRSFAPIRALAETCGR